MPVKDTHMFCERGRVLTPPDHEVEMRRANVQNQTGDSMNAYLFGAGASHSYDRSNTGVKPPLAASFFDAYSALPVSADLHVRVGFVVNYVRDTRGVPPSLFGTWNENIEDFLTEIDAMLGNPARAKALDMEQAFTFSKAYDQMVFLFSCVLNEIQNGKPCRHYAKLVRCMGDDDVLMTLNWDTLLDRVLWETGNWQVDDGYGLDFRGIYDDGWRKTRKRARSFTKLLKLHGSTNWLMPYRTFNLQKRKRVFANPFIKMTPRPIYCFVQAKSRYKTFGDRYRGGYQPFSYFYYPPDLPLPLIGERDGWVPVRIRMAPDLGEIAKVEGHSYSNASMPLIVSPVKQKEYTLMGNALGPVWRKAQSTIQHCETLTFVGYSFPRTDYRAWELLDNGIARRRNRLPVILVDPFPDKLGKRLRRRYGRKVELDVRQQTFADYAADLKPSRRRSS